MANFGPRRPETNSEMSTSDATDPGPGRRCTPSLPHIQGDRINATHNQYQKDNVGSLSLPVN
ncbi:hypothetical protein GALMADRAFT_227349 [Galerina marginata CBS 339.88]|uniref:Uncharacterized protein n=1 Tax=Galerina marginata (strain CBS 339.88) TaxID=685588 RepID=A0A067T2T7_GALM3|nr:hypothetical protein GALMADRAFT_227349 [Galerina marginata CBS 339.88]